MGILDEIGKRLIFFDGGTGSLLQEQGLKPGELPETWNITHPDVMMKLHKSYLEAGCDIIKTNTFGANGLKYHRKSVYTVDEIVTAALRNAGRAAEAVRLFSGKKGYLALDMGPTGKLLKPFGDLAFEDACQLYAEVVRIGVREGADLILIETMSDGYETKAAVLAAKENSKLPVFVTLTFDGRGKLLTGGDAASTVALLEGLGVDALGINCGLGPSQIKPILRELLQETSIPVIVNPNAGLPRSENGKTVYDIDADEFAERMREIAEMGACIIGGCCGTTPEHMRKTVNLCKDVRPLKPSKRGKTVISSYSHAVVIDRNPILIGERINPTGKLKLKQALKDHDLEYILREGVSQQEHGAHVLDVNVGLPGIEEAGMMEEVIGELQSMIDLPLQIDTSDLKAMERAMRIYNGKPLINSVSGKQESMASIFPLVKKYGGVVVALALDEEGIPETAEGRVAIAKKIYDTAAEYGIDKKDILIDALCLTVSSDPQGALTTLETLRRIRDELKGKTVLGVSNVSFGLPKREIINAAFFTMAMQNGLNAAIINPNSEAMMRSYYSFRALADMDCQCSDYIDIYSNQGENLGETVLKNNPEHRKEDPSIGMSLAESMERGLKERARSAVTELLESRDALEIINEEMIPALDRIGKGFERGTVFLPQLLMSAEAAKSAFEIIKDWLLRSGQVQTKKGKIILATVKGDIHDIGKNIVKVLLENYSYEVIDLGKDVPPELIVQTALDEKVSLVGLSALMTTTVPSMEKTIQLLRQADPGIKVMVGGAVLTEEYAETIDADQYCKDAMASVHYAEKVLQSRL